MALHLNAILPFLWPMRNVFLGGHYVRGWWHYWRTYRAFRRLASSDPAFPFSFWNTFPLPHDRYDTAGVLPKDYFFQDLWAARKVFDSQVKVHHDIGSRLDGFIAHCLSFCRVVMIDVRPLPVAIPNLEFVRADATDLAEIPSETITSLSSLHAVEHFGLGRYGDKVFPLAYQRAIHEMVRILSPGGNLYFSVPIGQQRLEFNALRIFDPVYVCDLFAALELVEFSVVDSTNVLHVQADLQNYRRCRYACGLFWFRKPG